MIGLKRRPSIAVSCRDIFYAHPAGFPLGCGTACPGLFPIPGEDFQEGRKGASARKVFAGPGRQNNDGNAGCFPPKENSSSDQEKVAGSQLQA